MTNTRMLDKEADIEYLLKHVSLDKKQKSFCLGIKKCYVGSKSSWKCQKK